MPIVGFIILLGVLGAVAYWLLVTTEGVFLGKRMVIWLYDLTAHKYDAIKQFDEDDERHLIVRPILRETAGMIRPCLLDVATGSGRVPFDLAQEQAFRGTLVGLDPALEMLKQAANKLYGQENGAVEIQLIQQMADRLPFKDDSFDIVTCLESLEFFPSDSAAVAEMVRVLRPGGLLMTTRRRGIPAYFFLRRYRSTESFREMMQANKLIDVQVHLWETDYDLVTGRKSDGRKSDGRKSADQNQLS